MIANLAATCRLAFHNNIQILRAIKESGVGWASFCLSAVNFCHSSGIIIKKFDFYSSLIRAF